MRRSAAGLILVMVVAVLVAPAEARLGPGGFMSDNVTWVANIPIDAPGIGARVVKVGEQTRLYVTSPIGLTIYDVSNPALPVPLGHTAYPHWENEDVEVAADGNTVIIAADIGFMVVIDTSIVTAPHVLARIPGREHTMSCADPACDYVYGSEGNIYDLRDKANPKQLDRGWSDGLEYRGGHDLNRAADGRMISDTHPRFMFDVSDPVNPRVLTQGEVPPDRHLAYQHNNLRPQAELWRPRAPGDDNPALRPGELMMAEGETNATIECDGASGPFATWSVRDFDEGRPMELLHVFRPVNGNWEDGNPALNVGGCSGHWFDWRDGIVAAGWYDHGTRFLDVDSATGEIREAGFFQPVLGAAWAAYWVSDEYVYAIDFVRGIDILHFDRSAPRPSQAEIEASWLAKMGAVPAPAVVAEQYACRLGAA